MFNKTDEVKNDNTDRTKSANLPEKLTNSQAKLHNISSNSGTGNKSPLNRAGNFFQGLSWSRKATILAVAFGTLPILG